MTTAHDPVAIEDAALLERPAERRTMVVVVNPHASRVRDGRLRHVVVAALASRYDVEAVDTDAPGHATGLAGAAARAGADVVVTLGGDGTVNEAANGLAGSGVPLFPLPGGSQNVFAKLLGIPGDLVDAAEHLLRLADAWRPRTVDLGRVNGRAFTFSAGAGLDARVVERVEANPARKARWREWFFMESALVVAARDYLIRPPRLVAQTGLQRVEGIQVLVQNGEQYTFSGSVPVSVCRDIALDDGTLSAAVLRKGTPLAVPTLAARLLSPRLEVTGHRQVTALPGLHDLVVRPADGEPFPLHADGDDLGRVDEARFGVDPGALTVVA
ncbi:MAG: NAD(+)/NADH kinase [Solirubrobacteraceae bacterium]|jgi:diacylglycerol kinase family enzyme|nr:NAD(+)/NADH kinase [Solirubrobacteraceae bacterium]